MKTKTRLNPEYAGDVLGRAGQIFHAYTDGTLLPQISGGDGSTITRTAAQIFDECCEAGVRYRELRETPEGRRGDTWEADRRAAAQNLLELNTELDAAMRLEQYMIDAEAWHQAVRLAEAMERNGGSQGELRGPLAAFAPTGSEYRSPGAIVTESEEYQNRTSEGFGEVEVRNLLTGTDILASGSHLFAPVGTPFLPPQGVRRRRLFITDLITVQPTGLNSVPYIRELNALTNESGAQTVAEGSAKPEVTMEFEQDDAPVRKIAAWIQATMEAFDDAPTLRGYVDGRLAYMLMVARENQILSGNGTAPNIKGIKTFSGTQTQTGEFYAGVGQAIGKIENVDGDADGVAVNPLTYWAAVTDRHAEGFDGWASGSPGASAPFGVPTPTAWGLDVVRTRALAENDALVGAYRLGATFFEREGVTVRATDSHASLFISNVLVVLAELRGGLAVHRPDWFVEFTVTPPS